jgi:large subunit ribosomal protein L4
MATKKTTATKKVAKTVETVDLKKSVFSTAGKEVSTISLPESVWGLPWNADLVHQVVTGMQSNARTGLADSRGRADVSGGGKKPWRQKGTGRARHGSSRSPIWKGGGVTHGPLAEKNYDKKINKKTRAKALFVVLSQKLRDGKVLFVDSLDLKAIKTKDAMDALVNLSKVEGFKTINTKKDNNLFLVVPKKSDTTAKSFRNIFHVTVEEVRNLNPVDVLNYRYLVIAAPEESNKVLEAKLAK